MDLTKAFLAKGARNARAWDISEETERKMERKPFLPLHPGDRGKHHGVYKRHSIPGCFDL